jgi:hypothetical protein
MKTYFSYHWRELVFFAIILLVMFVAASYEIDSQTRSIQPAQWRVHSGDEPHYMLTVFSLLKDGDLDVHNNYENIRNGGLDAGRGFRGQRLDHHTFIIDKSSGEKCLWTSVFFMDKIDCPPNIPDEKCFKKTEHHNIDFENIVEINAHPVFFPAILAVSIAIFSPEEKQIEPYCIAVLILYSWLALILLYIVGRQIGMDRIWCMLSILLLLFASPWLAYSRSLFTETFCSLMLIAALLSFLNKRVVLSGILISVAMAIKPLHVVIGFGWIIYLLIKRRLKEALVLTVTMGALGIGICLFNYWKVGTIFITGNTELSFISSLLKITDELTNSEHSLFLFAPWTVVVFWWLIRSFAKGPDLELLIALPTLLYYVVIATKEGSHGYCYGCRYWVPLLPWFSLIFIRNLSCVKTRAMKLILAIPVVAGIVIIVPGILCTRLLWSHRFDVIIKYLLSYFLYGIK